MEFTFNGQKYSIYTNGKIYGRGIQYFEIKTIGSYAKPVTGQWDTVNKYWHKQPGGAFWNDAIAQAAGLK